MLKPAFAIMASLALCACASVGPLDAARSPPTRSFDSAQSAPAEAPLWLAARPFTGLDRRRFSLPSRRLPDLRAILATAYDRARRPEGRRRAPSRMRAMRRPLLTY